MHINATPTTLYASRRADVACDYCGRVATVIRIGYRDTCHPCAQSLAQALNVMIEHPEVETLSIAPTSITWTTAAPTEEEANV